MDKIWNVTKDEIWQKMKCDRILSVTKYETWQEDEMSNLSWFFFNKKWNWTKYETWHKMECDKTCNMKKDGMWKRWHVNRYYMLQNMHYKKGVLTPFYVKNKHFKQSR